ncbi:hypothetical protein GF327_06220 [Candidatus Woesearchaeota archaeon]|nr:hypothetical protein [Candidatus Woesearchaeota archaeon]
MNIVSFVIRIIIFVISSLPLYFAVKILKGKTSLLKTVIVNFISGIVISAVYSRFRFFGGLLSFFLLIWIYREVFRLKWYKAFFAWLLQGIIVAVFYTLLLLFGLLFGLSLFAGVF